MAKKIKTTKYFKNKKKAVFTIITECNNLFILPTVRIYFDKSYYGGYDKLYLEFSWLTRTLAIKLK